MSVPRTALVLAALAVVALPATAGRRPDLDRLKQIVARHPGDIAGIRRELAGLDVTLRVRDFCTVTQHDRVSCVDLDALIKSELPGSADQNMLRLALNDALDVLGKDGGGAMDTLAACSNAHGDGFTDVFAVGGGPQIGGPSGPLDVKTLAGRAKPDFGDISATLSGSAAGSMVKRCRDAQMGRIRSQLGQATPGDPGYQKAVDNAVSGMDAAAAQCRDGNGAIALDPSGDGSGAAKKPDKTPDGSAAPKPGEGGEAGGKEGEKRNPGDTVVAAMNVAKGIAEVILNAAETAAHPGSALAKTVVSAVATAGSATGVVANSETAENVARAADVTTAVVELAAAAPAHAAGTAAVVGFDLALPVAAAGAGGYAAERLVNAATGGAIDRAAVDAVGAVSDWYFNRTNDIPSGKGGGTRLPNPTGDGKPSCADLQARWNAFKSYCSQPGNNWRTYDCAVFVAKMNGCADPAIINPGPEGDYSCRARCGRGITSSTCTEDAVAACEAREKLKGQLAQPVRDGNGKVASCLNYYNGLAGLRGQLVTTIKKKLCERAQGDFCDGTSGSGGAGAGPVGNRPVPAPNPALPKPATPRLPVPGAP